MNKFKKQLIAVGLSAVTAVTMVSTVFADEETTNPNTVDSTTQVQEVNETQKDDSLDGNNNLEVNSNQEESDQIDCADTEDVDAVVQSDGSENVKTVDESSNKKSYVLRLLYFSSGSKNQTYSKIETRAFEYSATATTDEVKKYLEENRTEFTPNGYEMQMWMTDDETPYYISILNDSSFLAYLYRNPSEKKDQSTQTKEYGYYDITYVDQDTNETVTTENHFFVQNVGTSLKTVYLKDFMDYSFWGLQVPNGYVYVDDKITFDENKTATVYVKKGDLKTQSTLVFYAPKNGEFEKLVEKTIIAQDYDSNKDCVLSGSEIQTLIPSGYSFANYQSDSILDFRVLSYVYKNCEVYLNALSTVTQDEKSSVKVENTNSVNTTLVNSLTNKLKTAYKKAIDEGEEVNFVPTVTTANLDSKSEKAVKAEASKLGYSSVEVFDITLAMNIDGEQAGTITETTSPLTFKVTIPETLKKDGRKFYVLRYHDGKVEKLDVDENGYFTTDKFSVYMLVYEDVKTTPTDNKKEDTSKEEDSNTTNTDKAETDSSDTKLNSTKDNNKKTTTDSKKSNGVNTSTRTNGSLFVGFGALALTGAAIVGVLKKKSELD